MTHSPLGFIFSNYEYRYQFLFNDIIQQTLVEAGQKIDHQLENNPALANQALDDEWFYIQEAEEYLLGFIPNEPEMTYGDIPTIIPLISTWATQYAGVECEFEIWVWPGTSTQRKLGRGALLLAPKLPKMPGDRDATFPYHMDPDKPLGLIFTHYDYGSTFDNKDIEQLLAGARREYDRKVERDPALVNQTFDGWQYDHNPLGQGEDYYTLFINGEDPAMTWGEIPNVIAELKDWTRAWRTVETDFQIWARPGTVEQRRLGWGSILFII
ncbi:MAG: hypothetical protein Q9170_002566 [Blastenia crenularia]